MPSGRGGAPGTTEDTGPAVTYTGKDCDLSCNTGTTIAIVIAIVIACLVLVCCCVAVRRRKTNKFRSTVELETPAAREWERDVEAQGGRVTNERGGAEEGEMKLVDKENSELRDGGRRSSGKILVMPREPEKAVRRRGHGRL
ncbi:hypothetical protein CC86DRAFT_366814 [Ophiobolus disseminans]|uniref:Uncharacterized protein n=1 Tax=Ophiobolus disseminans TaxID=1469910 RepID=A0A6A7ADQ9_9PLEO|nr:hypothetical protein CC86DRAFT_366814 [Ophiobolus disseminans]